LADNSRRSSCAPEGPRSRSPDLDDEYMLAVADALVVSLEFS